MFCIRMFAIFFFPIFMNAAVFEYLKPIVDKGSGHSFGNIDFIYMINLDERPEKFSDSLSRLLPYGVVPYRFSAVNGWKLTFEELEDLGTRYSARMGRGRKGTYYPEEAGGQPMHEVMNQEGRSYFAHCMPRGAVGILLSHLSILKDAWDSGYKTIWIMEDDVDVVADPGVLPDLIRKLDATVGSKGWDILFTDQDTKGRNGGYIGCYSYAWRPDLPEIDLSRFARREKVGAHFTKVGARYGAYSMIVRRSGMEKILSFFKKRNLFLPYDMEYTLPKEIRLYSLVSDVVTTQSGALSDNGGPNYLKNAR